MQLVNLEKYGNMQKVYIIPIPIKTLKQASIFLPQQKSQTVWIYRLPSAYQVFSMCAGCFRLPNYSHNSVENEILDKNLTYKISVMLQIMFLGPVLKIRFSVNTVNLLLMNIKNSLIISDCICFILYSEAQMFSRRNMKKTYFWMKADFQTI